MPEGKTMNQTDDKQSPSTACRADGRCQYAIDHGAEGLGHCPVGECVQPSDPADIYEEEYTTQSSVGGTHEHSHRAALAAVVAAISARSAIDPTLAALRAKAGPGPWYIDADNRPGMDWNRHIFSADGLAVCFMAHSDGKAPMRDSANAELIVAAVNRIDSSAVTEIAPTPEGLAGMVRNQQDAGADLLRAAHAAAKAEGTPLAEEVPLVRRLHDQRDRCAALLRECLAGVVTDCTDWNRRAREALKDIPDAEQQLRNIAAAMRDDGPSKP